MLAFLYRYQEKKNLDQRVHVCANCGYTQQRDIAAAEVMLLWSQNKLPGLGTNPVDADGSSTTKKRRETGSLRQLSQVKRQKSQPTGGDVETPPYFVEGGVVDISINYRRYTLIDTLCVLIKKTKTKLI